MKGRSLIPSAQRICRACPRVTVAREAPDSSCHLARWIAQLLQAPKVVSDVGKGLQCVLNSITLGSDGGRQGRFFSRRFCPSFPLRDAVQGKGHIVGIGAFNSCPQSFRSLIRLGEDTCCTLPFGVVLDSVRQRHSVSSVSSLAGTTQAMIMLLPFMYP